MSYKSLSQLVVGQYSRLMIRVTEP